MTDAVRRSFVRRRPIALVATLAIAAAGLLASGSKAEAAELTCPSTFHVLHDDRVGPLHLPEGHYEITLLDGDAFTCERAADRFRVFLERYAGNLPGNWHVVPAASEFRRGTSNVGFRVERVENPNGGGGGRHPATGTACPDLFSVLHNDHIGRLSLPKGQYRITVLATGRPPCARAAKLFARFLQHWDGKLPAPWKLHVATATFYRSPHFGFRVKHAGGGGGGGGGGGVHPGPRAQRCPGTFRVLHNDRIGKLRLQQGRYRITVRRPAKLGCARASRLLTRFLQNTDGRLPGNWRVKPRTATFLRGTSGVGFRIKLVR